MMSKPLKIALVNMPFAMTCMPSLGLAQLEAVLKARFGAKVQVATHYLNLDFARQVDDLELYHHPYSPQGFMTEAGEWLFRSVAFPEVDDNTSDYLNRFYFEDSPDITRVRGFLQYQKAGLEESLERLIDQYQLLEADLVGFSLLFSQTMASFALARLLKQRKPELVTLFGGASCEGEMGQAFAECVPQVDYCFSGPALVSLPEFIQCKEAGNLAGCDRINGVFSKTNRHLWGDGREGTLAPVGDDLDIDACVLPDYHSFLEAQERLFPKPLRTPVLLFETSRGCARAQVKACRFCGLNGLTARYRPMKAENAIRQINNLWQYIPRSMFFMAVDNLLPPAYPQDVFAHLTPPGGMAMRYEVRPDLSDADIQSLCQGGVTWFQPGIEALSTSTLKLMSKGVTAFSNLRFLKDCTKHPVTLEWNLLIGTPGEESVVWEKYMRDLPLMMHLAPPAAAFPIMFVKYSHYYEHQAEYGLQLEPQEAYSYLFPFKQADLKRVAYRFSNAAADSGQLATWLERLNGLIRRWRERRDGLDGRPPARLCLVEEAEGASIYDTRSGEAVWHSLSSSALRLIRFLEKPADRSEMVAQLPDEALQIQNDLDLFVARGWVFEEDGRYLSLLAG